jgi:colanic acid/amylovoran biosynthesis protein
MRVFDIVGVNYRNKGAHLMLRAMCERLKHAPFPALLSVNMKLARHARRHGENLYASLWLEQSRPGKADALVRGIGVVIPKAIKKKYRLIADRNVDVILDGSGFLYGDQWGLRGIKRRLACAQLWERQRKHLVLMPQAFGPFSSEESKTLMAELIDLSTLIYARDRESLGYLRDVAPTASHLRLAPDFTGLVEPKSYPEMEVYRGWVGIVPNTKMVTKENRGRYSRFLNSVIRRLYENEQKVFFLIHETSDLQLAQALLEDLGVELPIHYRDDPAELKAVIGACRFVVASRFHAIVSALSQGVPVVGTSWSHKYRYLFDDYNAMHLLVEDLEDGPFIERLLDNLSEPGYRKGLSELLKEQSDAQKSQIEAMWKEVFSHTCRERIG